MTQHSLEKQISAQTSGVVVIVQTRWGGGGGGGGT